MKKLFPACLLLATAFTTNVAAQQYEVMDYGPFLTATFVAPRPAGNVAYRGVAVPFTVAVPGEILEGPYGLETPTAKGKGGKKGKKDASTQPPELYRTPRIAFGGYQLNVPAGTYKVTLHFCETGNLAAKGQRVFDVLLQGKKVVEGLDIFARAGAKKPLDLTFDGVEVKESQPLLLSLKKQKGDTLLCGLAIEGKNVIRKIHCGGKAVKDYAADWPAGFDALASVSKAGVLFDTEMLRYAAVWSRGFLKLDGVLFNGAHGPNPGPLGFSSDGKNQAIQFATKAAPGWAHNGSLKDPRPKNVDPRGTAASVPYGPLPREWGRYTGLYRHDNGVVFKYAIGSTDVLDLPSFEIQGDVRFFCRTLNVQPTAAPQQVVIADFDAPATMDNGETKAVVSHKGNEDFWISFQGGPAGTQLALIDGSRVVLNIPANKETTRVKIGEWSGLSSRTAKVRSAFAGIKPAADLLPLTKGGKARFTTTVTTKGKRGADDKGAYTVDSIKVPFDNPYKSWMRFGGVDFFSDGRAAITTWSGDVWIVSGLDDKLDKVTWKRFASGLFQPLGIKIVDDVIHVVGRDGITKLHDLNGDGEADYYECFCNDFNVSKNFHEFVFGLDTDPQGNFYFTKAGPVKPGGRGWDEITPSNGSLFKVSKDGRKVAVIARGFRAPNGMAVGPHGEITTGDNEGTWTPTSPINWIKTGGFYGVPEFSQRSPLPTVRDNPLCWIPKDNDPYGQLDNSCGCQVWITGTKFGPLSGQLLHTSYGTCTLFNVLKEEVGGQMQGGVVPLPLHFDSGIMRARFIEKQNALYLVGLRGWQTTATEDAGFFRVRYTGKPANLPVDLHVDPTSITLKFSDPLDKKTAESLGNYSIQRWNYKWTENYGSPHFKVSNPKKQGHDDMDLQAAVLSPDGKTLTLKVADLHPVMQMRIVYRLKAADGSAVRNQVLHTINVVGDMRGEVHVGEYRVVKR